MDTTEKPAIGEPAADTLALRKRLEQMLMGDLVSYEELTRMVGGDIRENPWYSYLGSARTWAQRTHGFVFVCVKNEGLKRLDDVGIVESAESRTKHINKTARRGIAALDCVQFERLNRDQQHEHNARKAQYGLVSITTGRPVYRRLKEHIKVSNQELNLGQTLELLK